MCPPRSRLRLLICAGVLVVPSRATAQGPPPPIPHFVVDVRGTMPRFGSDPQLAGSRGLSESDLPGGGFGVDADANVYLLRWKVLAIGFGGQLALGRSRQSVQAVEGQAPRGAVTERFTSIAPELSFNFGSGDGWSYISGGMGTSTWSIVQEGSDPLPADTERLRTINYGGGARWFLNPHVAFHFDARFYQIDPGLPAFGYPGSPRTTLLIVGAGVALK